MEEGQKTIITSRARVSPLCPLRRSWNFGAVQQLKEFHGTKLKQTLMEGLDLGDHDEKKTLEELKIESEPLRKLMKDAFDDKVEEELQVAAMDSGNDVGASKAVDVGIEVDDTETALAEQRREMAARGQGDVERTRQHAGAAAWQRQPHSKQHQQPRKKEVEEKGRAEREKGTKGQKGRGQEGRKKEEEKEAEEERDEQVKKDAMDWTLVTRSKKQKQRRSRSS